jgi:alkanesulfonate monooxygenase SsuD/methylene tetrahydromethanopterin reductase-like flavin-dependent oxidoreductase (luciferase family)
MDFGINLPVLIPGVTKEQLLEWAIRADQGSFSSLVTFDRLVWANHEPLMTLAAVASVTQRIELIAGVLVSPMREVSLMAKQIASLDVFADGRLTIGIGVGNKVVDFQAAAIPYNRRGKILDEQVERMKYIWSGQPVGDDGVAIGPLPVQAGGPKLLFGGSSSALAQRISRWGDGFIASASTPEATLKTYQEVKDAWNAAERVGKPRFVVAMYYALGPDAAEQGATVVSDYYAFLGPKAKYVAKGILTTPEALKEAIQMYEGIGVDEIILASTAPGNDQLDRVIDVIGM